MRGVYAITDCDNLSTHELLSTTEKILRAGIAALQYRDKSGDLKKRNREAQELQRLCREYDCLFIVNDDVQLAKLVTANGVHLGCNDCDCKAARKELGPDAIVGVSCYNSLKAAQDDTAGGADYVAFGSFYPTTSKQNTTIAKPEIIKQAKQKISLPIVAIGGITPTNCGPLIEYGADMLAVISSIYQAGDPYTAVKEFNRYFFRHRGHRAHKKSSTYHTD